MAGTSDRPHGADTMFNRTFHVTAAALAALSAASIAAPVWAGPAVGTIVGTPSPAVTTVNAKVISATPVVAQDLL